MFNRYGGGHSFGSHVDNAIRQVPGHAASRPHRPLGDALPRRIPTSYDGGELVVDDTYGAHAIKLPAGHMVLYPSTSLHHVTPVTRGARIASFFWIQSLVRDDGQRTLLFDMDTAIQQLAARRARSSVDRAAHRRLSQPAPAVGGALSTVMTFRKILFWAHLVAGVVAGTVILVMCVTGTLLTFQQSALRFIERDQRFVSPAPGAARLDVDALLAQVRLAVPDAVPYHRDARLRSAGCRLGCRRHTGNALRQSLHRTSARHRVGSGRGFYRSVTNWHRGSR